MLIFDHLNDNKHDNNVNCDDDHDNNTGNNNLIIRLEVIETFMLSKKNFKSIIGYWP